MEYEGHAGLHHKWLGEIYGLADFNDKSVDFYCSFNRLGELGYGYRKSPSTLRNVKFRVNSAACSHEPPRG